MRMLLIALVLSIAALAEDKYKAPVPGPYNCYIYEYRTNLPKLISLVTLGDDGTYRLTNGTERGKWQYQPGSKSVVFEGGPYGGSNATFEPARGRILVIPQALLGKDQYSRNWGTHYCWIRDKATGRSVQ
jgi:hypothetical protein